MLKLLLLAIILVVLALLGLSVKLLFDKKAEFKAGSCSAAGPELEEQGISGCCGGQCRTEIH